MTTSDGESTPRAVGRLALAVLSAPIAAYGFVGAAFTGVGGSAGDPGSNLAQVVFWLLLALAMPTGVIVSGILAIRSHRAKSPSLVMAALLVAGVVALAALAGITPLALSHSGNLASHLEAVAEQDDLTPAQLRDAVQPVFDATLDTIDGLPSISTSTDLARYEVSCETASGAPGVAYEVAAEWYEIDDIDTANRQVRDIWTEAGFEVVTTSRTNLTDTGLSSEGSAPIERLRLEHYPALSRFELTTACVLDPTVG